MTKLKEILMTAIMVDEKEYCFDKSYCDDATWRKENGLQTREERFIEAINGAEEMSVEEILRFYGDKYDHVLEKFNPKYTKSQLVQLATEMIKQSSGYGSISIENREAIRNHLGYHNSKIDELINKFYSINCKVANGGAPILKQILDSLVSFEIKLERATACLMLKRNGELVDYIFINQFVFESMTTNQILNEVKEFAEKNSIEHYAVNIA